MTVADIGSVVLTGPTRGLGRETALALAGRPAGERPDLVLLGRGQGLDGVVAEALAAGATVVGVPVELGSLASVAAAAAQVREAVTSGAVRPLRAVVANAALQTTDIHSATADGYETTFAVGHLAHVLLLRELDDLLRDGARVVLVGSGTHRGGAFQNRLGVPDPQWEDPEVLATPGRLDPDRPGDALTPARRAYATTKLATLYHAHQLQRRLGGRAAVSVFDPGLMPGTGLVRTAGPGVRLVWNTVMKAMRVLPGVSSPRRSGRALADLAVSPRWAGLRDGAYVEIDRVTDPAAAAFDESRERRLQEAGDALVDRALAAPGRDPAP
ncbi:MAG: SDR family NAD(P)-dependent oxidoreductase [Kineosporiaceae bacterium]